MNILENPLCDHIVQICLHELENKVNIPIIVSFDGVEKLNYVYVVNLPKNFNLSVCPLSICGVLESIEYFF